MNPQQKPVNPNEPQANNQAASPTFGPPQPAQSTPAQNYFQQPGDMPAQPSNQGYVQSAPQVSTGYGYAAAPRKRNLKTPLLIVGLVLFMCLLAGGGYFVYNNLGGVSKEDFIKGSDTLAIVSDKYYELSGNVYKVSDVYTYATGTEIANDISTTNASLAEMETAQEELSKEKMLKDKSINEKYKTYKEKYDAYVAFVATVTESFSKVSPAISTCESAGQTYSRGNGADFGVVFTACETALNGIGSVPDPDFNAVIVAYKKYFADAKTAINAYNASFDKRDYTGANKYMDQYYTAKDALNDALDSAQSNVDKRRDDASPDEEISELLKAVSDKLYTSAS